MVRAKFECSEIEEINDRDGKPVQQTVRFFPVYAETGENKAFWDATPSGEIRMTINNRNAFGEFKRGRKYYVDFIETD